MNGGADSLLVRLTHDADGAAVEAAVCDLLAQLRASPQCEEDAGFRAQVELVEAYVRDQFIPLLRAIDLEVQRADRLKEGEEDLVRSLTHLERVAAATEMSFQACLAGIRSALLQRVLAGACLAVATSLLSRHWGGALASVVPFLDMHRSLWLLASAFRKVRRLRAHLEMSRRGAHESSAEFRRSREAIETVISGRAEMILQMRQMLAPLLLPSRPCLNAKWVSQ